jgi:hypothetical protein
MSKHTVFIVANNSDQAWRAAEERGWHAEDSEVMPQYIAADGSDTHHTKMFRKPALYIDVTTDLWLHQKVNALFEFFHVTKLEE